MARFGFVFSFDFKCRYKSTLGHEELANQMSYFPKLNCAPQLLSKTESEIFFFFYSFPNNLEKARFEHLA